MLKFVDFIIEHSESPQLNKCMQRMKIFFNRAKLTDVAEKTMKMTFKKYRGNVWICQMLGREYVYDTRVT